MRGSVNTRAAMKILRFLDARGRTRLGEPQADGWARLYRGELFEGLALTDQRARVAKRLAPVDPPNVFAIGLNYRGHADETGAGYPSAPVIFLKASTSVTGAGSPILLPKAAPEEVDYEAELAIIIGKTARNVSREEALGYVLGFTCANDVSARDCQVRLDKQWARAKSFDTFCPLGPVVVTPDEIDPDRVAIRTTVNGRVLQESNTSDMIFGCRELVSYLSAQFTLLAGTVICTGTPSGVGFARKPAVFLRDGDEVTVEIEGIGRLTNTVVKE